MILTIPRIPPSLNRNKHWAAKHREMKTWKQELDVLKRTWKSAEGKVKVTITIFHSRQYDRDNAYGACKPILDAMKQLGMIVDDRAAYCDLTVKQEKSTHKEKRTVIEVEAA